MAHSKDYWEKRAIQLFTTQDKDNDRLTKRLNKEYDRVNADIEKEIASYYSKYGKDGVIEYRKLVVSLSESERDLLYKNMEAFVVKYPEYADLMPVRESIYKLNRLEGLQLSIRQNMLELGAIEQKEFDKTLAAAYEHGYLSSMKGLENPPAFFKVDKLVMQQTINQKWVNDKNFSDRIWDNKERLLNTMNNEIRDGLIRGESYTSMTKALRYRTGVGKSDAERLLHTEAAFVLNEANAQAFMEAGVLEYENTAVMDSRTSPTCRDMDGQVFKFSERMVGLNAPPYHARCRTTIIPRESTQVKVADKKEIEAKLNDGIRFKLKNEQVEKLQTTLDSAPQKEKELWATYQDKLFLNNSKSKTNYFEEVGGVHFNSNFDFTTDKYHKGNIFFHEFGHHLDSMVSTTRGEFATGIKLSNGKTFGETILDDVEGMIKSQAAKKAMEKKSMLRQSLLEDYDNNLINMHSISDLYGGATKNQLSVGSGHQKSYWEPLKTRNFKPTAEQKEEFRNKRLGQEAFAMIYAAKVNNPEELAMFEKWLPSSLKMYDEVIDLLLKGGGNK